MCIRDRRSASPRSQSSAARRGNSRTPALNSSLGNVNAAVKGDQADFDAAVAMLREASFRSELQVREIAAPERIAPRSLALAAGVVRGSTHPADDGDAPYGAGRLCLLHDPASVSYTHLDVYKGQILCCARLFRARRPRRTIRARSGEDRRARG